MKKLRLYLALFASLQLSMLGQIYGLNSILPNECPEECLCYLINDLTDCSGQNLTELPASISKQVKVLDLSYNSFEDVPRGLAGFKTLTSLHLNHNHIQHLDAASLNMGQLKELDLSHNKIIYWRNMNPNEVIQQAVSLTKLTLAFNDIRIIDGDGLHSDSLEVLDLENCSLRNISSSFLQGLYNIQKLVLANNRLRDLALESGSLVSLNLTHNFIEAVPINALTKLPRLKELTLSQNRIRTFHRVQSSSLEKLEMAFCHLEGASLGFLSSLRYVVLKGNYIRKLGNRFFSNPLLEFIDLSSNAIDTIDPFAFANLTNVAYIDLSLNQISKVHPRTFSNNTYLKILNLSRNYLTTISFQSSSLKHLDVSYCEIQIISEKSMRMFPELQRLELSRNLLRTLPPKIELQSLEYLDVSMNKLSDLTNNTLSYLSNLKELNLAGNRFTSGIKASYFPETLNSVILDDNLWICNCYEVDFRQLYDYLAKPPAKIDIYRLICHSPENITSRTWHLACSHAWYQEKGGRREKMWLYAVSMVFAMTIIFFVVLSIKKMYEKKQVREQRERERIAEEARERLRRLRSQHRQDAQRNAPDPRELQRPPSYAEAVLMPRIDGSTASLNASRTNVSSSNPDISRKTRERRTQQTRDANKPKKRKTKRTQSETSTVTEIVNSEAGRSADEAEPTSSSGPAKDPVTESNL